MKSGNISVPLLKIYSKHIYWYLFFSLQLFERVKLGKIVCIYSDLTETELANAPKKVKEYFKNLPKDNLEK
jgi:hypothetical protein